MSVKDIIRAWKADDDDGFAHNVGGVPVLPVLYRACACRNGTTGSFPDFLGKADDDDDKDKQDEQAPENPAGEQILSDEDQEEVTGAGGGGWEGEPQSFARS